MANPCRDRAPGQPRADSHGICRPSPATKLAFSGARGRCACSCPLAADKSLDRQRPARRQRRQRRNSIPIARHHLSGGLAQRDLLTTGRGATPSRAAAWARRARQSKDSLHHADMRMTLHCCRSLRRLGSQQRVEFSPSNSRLIDPTADIFFGVPTVLERSRDSMSSPKSIKKGETRLAS